MTSDSLRRTFEYELWADRQFLESLTSLSDDIHEARRLFSHILASQLLWLDRIEGRRQEMAVWPDLSLDECSDVLDRMEERWKKFLGALPDAELETEFSYTNTKGQLWTNTIGDTLAHLLLHNSYHRGQIATALRRTGIDPPYTDYIHATRQNLI